MSLNYILARNGNNRIQIAGMCAVVSPTYRNRYECFFFASRGMEIKSWIRTTFGDDDDLVYTNGDIDGSSVDEDCGALITDQQLTLTILRWS